MDQKPLGLLRKNRENSRLSSSIKQTNKTITKLETSLKKENESLSRISAYLKARALYHQDKKAKKPRKLRRQIDLINLALPREKRDENKKYIRFKIHQKKRRLGILKEKLKKLEKQKAARRWSLCFGSKQLLRKQNHLVENGYQSHEDWKADWVFSRSNQSYWLGDTNETARNRNAKISFEGSIASLRLTVPEALRSKYGNLITINNLSFHKKAEEQIKLTLESNDGKAPLSYRIIEREKIVHDRQGRAHKKRQMYLQVSLQERFDVPMASHKGAGAIGVDLNCHHLAVGEVDRSGNPVQAFHIDYFENASLDGKSSDQISAMFGDQIRDIVAYAKLKYKPIVIEKLDFKLKRSALRELHSPRVARLLSSFAYSKFLAMMSSRCQQEGVKLLVVNPAFSSVLGAYNYFGLKHLYSSHQMAAFILARRGMGFGDSLKCIHNERRHTALLRAVSIAPERAPPSFEAWIQSGGRRHRWSLLRRYYQTYSLFMKHMRPKLRSLKGVSSSHGQRRGLPLSPQNFQVNSV